MPTTNNKQKKDQFIAVCADSRDEAERLLPAARRMADCFHKGIIVFTCSPDGEQWVDTLGHPYAALKSDWPSAIEAMPTAFNVVLAMALCDHKARRDSMANPRQLLKNFRLSKVAYLSIPATVTETLIIVDNTRIATGKSKPCKNTSCPICTNKRRGTIKNNVM